MSPVARPPATEAVAPTFPPQARILLATSTSGLCNRLLNLAGSLRIARLLGREFLLHWPLNRELGAGFHELFENDLPLATTEHMAQLLHTESRVTVYQTERGGKVNRAYCRAIVPGDDAHILVVKGWGLPALRWEGPERARRESLPVLRELQPVAEVRALVERHAPPPGSVGIHVRRGDSAAFFARSQDEHYLALMRGVLAVQPGATFFLCTDDARAEATLREALPGRIHSLPKATHGMEARGSVPGMREAVADLWLLARTRAIVGNHRSTFSTTAALLGAGRLVVADATSSGRRLDASVRALLG